MVGWGGVRAGGAAVGGEDGFFHCLSAGAGIAGRWHFLPHGLAGGRGSDERYVGGCGGGNVVVVVVVVVVFGGDGLDLDLDLFFPVFLLDDLPFPFPLPFLRLHTHLPAPLALPPSTLFRKGPLRPFGDPPLGAASGHVEALGVGVGEPDVLFRGFPPALYDALFLGFGESEWDPGRVIGGWS